MIKLMIWIKTKLHGNLVGYDEWGNKYYESKDSPRFFGRKDRWALYKGSAEASKVPGQWFNWLHYQSNHIPNKSAHLPWEKAHKPNLTGTDGAYYPPGSLLASNTRDKATGDYERWSPKQVKYL